MQSTVVDYSTLRPYRVGGELMHKGPTVGKVKPGITSYCAELRGVL
jgi:hypothetical protein